MCTEKRLVEAITSESDLVAKLSPLSEIEIFDFMQNLRGGTYFNMGMYNFIPVSRAYKKTLRIYKIVNMTAIVSGVSYENIGTTKEFRDRTGEAPGHAWYNHLPGYENKVGVKKSDPNSKYVLWDIKQGSGSNVSYYVVDIATGDVTPVSKADVLNSNYLTDSEKAKLTPKAVQGFDKTTGELIENKTNWRTAAFEHIFWLSQSGQGTKEYGVKFMEDIKVQEAFNSDIFIDNHANVTTKLDDILSGAIHEDSDLKEELEEFNCGGGLFISKDDVIELTKDVLYDNYMYYSDLNSIMPDADERLLRAGFLTPNNAETCTISFPKGTKFTVCYISNFIVSLRDLVSNVELDWADVNSDIFTKNTSTIESTMRTVPRGNKLVDNELFVDFD